MILGILLYGIPVALLVWLVLTLNDMRRDLKRIAGAVEASDRT